ncbi:NmrA family NAD(P)-binding protein [Cryomorphaceae bacterium 1068]|nr:NmrA family NAD(P)-binding protein [Cryomorphaceae bacterium 1068]
MKNNIAVIGGNGKTGRRVVQNLENLNQNVFVPSRKGSIKFDWEDRSTYATALAGMDRAYIVYYPDLAVPGAKEDIKAFTDAALEAGLEKVVLLSGKGEIEAERCEEIVAQSGLNYTLVRASWFNQNFTESFLLDPLLAGHVALPMPEAEIPFVDAQDIADVVTKVLLDDSYNGKRFEVTGPRKLRFREVVEEIAKATGRVINYEPISKEAYKEGMKNAGLPDGFVWLFGYLFQEVLGNAENQTISADIESVLGREARDFRDFAEEMAQSGIWNQEVAQSM